MEEEKMKKSALSKGLRSFSRYRLIFVALAGVFALHLGWWQLVESYVPPEERPKRFEFLGKFDSLIQRDKKEET